MYACRKNLALSELLVKHGANVNARDCFGFTPIIIANDNEIIKLLVAYGADVNATDFYDEKVHGKGFELLSLQNFHFVQCLYHGSDGGWTALMWSAFFGRVERLRILISCGANLNAVSRTERNAVHAVFLDRDVGENAFTILQILVSEGADINHRSKNGMYGDFVPRRSPLFACCFYKLRQLSEGLVRLGCVYDFDAISQTEETLRKHMIEYVDKTWCGSPLHKACYNNDLQSLKVLLSKANADFNADVCDEDSYWTPLHVAVFMRHKEAVKLLVDRGADIFAATRLGHTALHLAAAGRGQSANDLVRILLKN